MADTTDNQEKDVGGRPTKYHDGMPQRVFDYLNEYIELGHVIPTKAGLSIFLDISKQTINEWQKEKGKEGFSDSLRKLESEQEFRLLAGGLNGDYNATIAKLGLGNHGYSDKQETKHSGDIDIKGLSLEQLEYIAKHGTLPNG